MKTCRRIACFLLCLTVLVALGAVGSAEITYTGSAPVFQEKQTISVLISNSGSKVLGFEDMAWWQEVLDRANVALEYEEIDQSSYNDVIRPRLAAAVDLPDIVKLSGRDDDMSYINAGIFVDLTDYYEQYGFNFKQQFEEHPNLKAEITTPDGRIFYIPYIYTSENNSRTLMVNMGYLDTLGIAPESLVTLDDFYDYLVKVKANDMNGNGDANDEVPLFCRSGMVQLWSMFWGLDLSDTGGYQAEDGKIKCGYADERYREFLTYMNRLYSEGLLYSEFASANLDTQNALFSSNQIGALVHFISNCTGYSQRVKPDWDFFNDAPIIQAIVPLTGPYGDQYAYGRDSLGSLFGITRFAKDPAAVFCFVDYLYSQEVGELTWYGLEGTDYEVADGEYVFSDTYLNNPNDYLSLMGYNFDGLPSYQLGGGYMAKQCKAVRDMSNDVLSQYIMTPSIPFSYKLPEENEVLRAYASDLSTYFSENLTAFIMGTRSLDTWDEYLAGLETMHLQDVIAVYQAAYDRAQAAK